MNRFLTIIALVFMVQMVSAQLPAYMGKKNWAKIDLGYKTNRGIGIDLDYYYLLNNHWALGMGGKLIIASDYDALVVGPKITGRYYAYGSIAPYGIYVEHNLGYYFISQDLDDNVHPLGKTMLAYDNSCGYTWVINNLSVDINLSLMNFALFDDDNNGDSGFGRRFNFGGKIGVGYVF